MNTNDIKKILNDLYAIDPGLRKHEKELTTLLQAMAIKPQAHYDAAFAATLRTQLLAEMKKNHAHKTSFADFFAGRTARYAAALAVAVIAIGVFAYSAHNKQSGFGGIAGSGQVALNSSKISIASVGSKAFGKLTAQSNTAAPEAANSGAGTTGAHSGNDAAAASAPTAGVASAPMSASMNATAASGGGTTAAIMRPIYPGGYYGVKYNYAGDPITQNQAQLDVLKKISTPLSSANTTAALQQAGFSAIDLSSFGNLGMSYVTLSQNEKFGYQITLDFDNGTISINQNYNEWPQGNVTPLTANDIPSDSSVIGTANTFLSDHGIATTIYGAPQVTHQNNNVYTTEVDAGPVPAVSGGSAGSAGGGTAVGSAAIAPTRAPAPAVKVAAMPMVPYYSDSEQVLYPLMVNGKNVYDMNGNQIGLSVEVNVRYNRVADVYGLSTQSYQSSAYDAITDSSAIITIAESTPSYPMIYNTMVGAPVSDGANGGVTLTTYDLGTPTMAYEDIYQTDSQGQTSEFLVPAYAFPVVGSAKTTPTRNIMVPLIKDFQQQNVPPRAVPYSNVKAL